MRGSTPFEGAIHSFRRSPIPATIVLIATNIFAFFWLAITHNPELLRWIGFVDPYWVSRPWTFFTWPLVGGGDPLYLFFMCLWAFWVCGSLERSWGTRTFVLFMAITAWFTALALLIGGRLLGQPAALAGLLVATAPPTIAWCTINRFETVSLWGVLPVPAPLIAVLDCVIVWYNEGPPLRGLFALTGCLAAWWYAQHGRYAYRGYAERRSPVDRLRKPKPGLRLVDLENDVRPGGTFLNRLNPMRWYRSWRTRREVEKLFKRSSGTDPRDR